MHVLPRVAELERRFGGVLEVVGVHSGKFVEERRTANIRQACERLGVHHPVVNDRQFRIWRSYAVNAWPTVVLLTPDGYVAGTQPGEFEVEPLAKVIAGLVERYAREGSLRSGALDFGSDIARPAEPEGALRFPTRVLAHGERLYVSDSGHHRLLELRLDGDTASVERAFGDGTDGYADGPAAVARFREPQGLALAGGTLYVADRAAHAIRAVALDTGEVTTIAGTGGLGEYRMPEGPGRDISLRSPWGLATDGSTLWVAMAGSHQIWTVDLTRPDHHTALFAGSGGENIGDGARSSATLAQTSGLALAGDRLFFADSESSAVRVVGLEADSDVRTLVGTGLFEFGDRDGVGDGVKLQHTLDVAVHGGGLLVADTYNCKVKALDPETRSCETLPGDAGSGEALYEPGGIWSGPQGVFVADTNHHRIVRLDPQTGRLTEITVRAEVPTPTA